MDRHARDREPDKGTDEQESGRTRDAHEQGADPGGITRRGFLQTGLTVAGGTLALGSSQAWAAGPGGSYQVSGYSGDEDRPGHDLRDGLLTKQPAVSERHEVVVIGAGMAGMAAAVRLRHLDLLVLETGSDIGGTSRAGRLGAHEFNIGAAYFTGNDGVHAQLWDEIGLPRQPLAEPGDRWFLRGKWIPAPWSDEGIAATPPDVQKPMRAMQQALKAINKSKDLPDIPYTKNTPKALAFDKITFAEWMKPWAQPDIQAFVDAYFHSALGASSRVISAFAGLNFYTEFFGHMYAYPEGNAHVIKVMRRKIDEAGANRIRTGCTIYRVVPDGSGARIYYVEKGQPKAVAAKRVVLGTPYFVTARLLPHLSHAQRYALNLGTYTSYFVVNLLFDREIVFQSYDSWIPSIGGFDDFIDATWSAPARHQQLLAAGEGQMIACFACARRPVLGRYKMLAQSPATVAAPVVEGFLKVHPEARSHLKHVHVTRWGHAFLISRPYMHLKWLPKVAKELGPLHLAHADGQAIPALETATMEGMDAAARILKGWQKKQ